MVNKKITDKNIKGITLKEVLDYGNGTSNADNGIHANNESRPVKEQNTIPSIELIQVYIGLLFGKVERLNIINLGMAILGIINFFMVLSVIIFK